MLFSSPIFLFLFLPAVLGLYFLAPRRTRNLVLLLASLLFYAWGEVNFVLVMLTSIAVNFALGLWLDRVRTRPAAQPVIVLAIVLNLGLLAWFKYANFLAANASAVLATIGAPPIQVPAVTLPLGISFFTFHALSYLIDVYRRQTPVQRNPIDFGLYIALFPQLIAGPIIRYHDIAAQLVQRRVAREDFAAGVRRFIIGLGKKMLIANTVAAPADAIFALRPRDLTFTLSWFGVLCYTLQIYFDFSGYSDMAIGLARMFGFRLLENFHYPYVSRSLTEFWRRWHISLSNWFRDYLYIPLGGNRRAPARVYGNLVTVFFLCGLWHGASWTFVVWGLFHGTFLVVERLGLGAWLERQWAPLRHGYAVVVIMVGWVLFRAATIPQALGILHAMAGGARGSVVAYHLALYLDTQRTLAVVAGVIGATPALAWLARWRDRVTTPALDATLALATIAGLALVLLTSAMLLSAGTYNPFIYFRF